MELFTQNQKNNFRLPLFFEDNVLKSHECPMLKIILLEEGSTILYINKRSAVLSAPALLCLNESENFAVQKEEGLVTKVIYFSPSIVNSFFNIQNIYGNLHDVSATAKLDHFYFIPFLDRNDSNSGLINIGPLTAKKISSVFNALKMQINNHNDEFWPCRSRSYLIEVLFIIQHCYSKKEILNIGLPEVDSNVNEIILFLHLNYSRKITIDELTKEFHTNRNTISRKFKKETGLSLIEYILKLRINVACILLRDTSLPVSEIMERVGFFDISHWGRAFKKHTGYSPTEYKNCRRNIII